MTYAQQLDAKIHEAIAKDDLETLDSLLTEHYREAEAADQPFDAAIELKPQYRDELGPGPFEGSVAINWANRISRARRLVVYRRTISGGFSGERIVSEGDSWFQYPILLDDVIDNFIAQKDFAVRSLGAAGDLVEHMNVRREYMAALGETGARVMLLSGGGNDLLGEGRLAELLLPYKNGMKVEDVVNKDALQRVADRILGYYGAILKDVEGTYPHVTIFGHGYDTPFPKKDGNYFGKPFAEAGIPLEFGRKVIEYIVDYYSARLSAFEAQFDNYRFIDLKGSISAHPNSWKDELHPKDAGFEDAAKRLLDAVRDHLAQLPEHGGFETEKVAQTHSHSLPTPIDPAPEFSQFESGSKTVVLDPGHGGSKNLPGASWNNAVSPSGMLEKHWTLDVCLRARPMLQARGYKVLMTRESDENLSGPARRNVARSAKADCFVSVHFNASKEHNAQGTETFIHTSATSKNSIALMRSVQATMVAALGHSDRNRKREPDGILRAKHSVTYEKGHHSNTAACLHEVSFMDRVDEDKRIHQADYRDRIARALADGITNYLSNGFEMISGISPDDLGGYDDAIHMRASELGYTVPQYLGSAETPHDGGGHDSRHIDGSALIADGFEGTSSSPMIDAMMADAKLMYRPQSWDGFESDSGSGDPDENEDCFIDPDREVDLFDVMGTDGPDRAQFEAAFSGFESAGFDYDEYSAFVGTLGLRYFAPGEFLVAGAQNSSGPCAGKNTPPPKSLWPNIAKTARMIDEIRHRLGYPVRILSGYRGPNYNTCIGGATTSFHMRFNALDWTCSQGSAADWHAVAKAVRGSSTDFEGGIGRYSSFIHIDTRGYEANW